MWIEDMHSFIIYKFAISIIQITMFGNDILPKGMKLFIIKNKSLQK